MVANGPLSAKFAPLAQTSSYATGYRTRTSFVSACNVLTSYDQPKWLTEPKFMSLS